MKRKLVIVLVLLALVGVGGLVADRMLKGRAHAGLVTFVKQWWVNYPASFAVQPLEISIKVDQTDLERIETVVQAARERGVIMPEGNDYVPAELEFEGRKIKVKLRIKGKMSDHVQGSKWSFRVIAKKDGGFLGMQRFSLQHPGTRNYLCDWFYHRLSKGEGIIALRYGFIQLKFNEEDLGIYAYEEHFGPELLANNGRLKGPLFRFDPGLFWEHRLNMLEKVRYNEAFGAYQAASVDAFSSDELAKDSLQRVYFERAVARMDAFRRAQLTASEVFDVDKLGRRHALLDLVGGHHSMDWSDVKFYFDPVLQRIEPISYESFSAFPIRTLAGADRYIGKQEASMDLHDAYFNDPVLFRAYVHHLERLSRPSYLDSAFAALAPALDSASALIYREFPYKELDRSIYYRNQLIIRKILDVPKGFHAYSQVTSDTVRVTAVPLEGIPMEVHGILDASGKLIPPLGPAIVSCRMPGKMGEPMEMTFVLPVTGRSGKKPLRLRYSVLGASVMKELDVFPYAYDNGLLLPSIALRKPQDLHTIPGIRVDEEQHVIHILPGRYTLDKDLFLPAGFTVVAVAPLRIDLQKGARIISRSPLQWKGMEEAPITIGSSDASGGGVIVLEANGRSRFEYVRFEGFGANTSGIASLVFQNADVDLVSCVVGEVRERDLFLAVRGQVGSSSTMYSGGKDQLTLAFCQATLTDVELSGAGDDAISVKGGMLQADRIKAGSALGSGLKVDQGAVVQATQASFSSYRTTVSVARGGQLTLNKGSLNSKEQMAVEVDAVVERFGPSRITIDKVSLKSASGPVKIGKGNSVTVDGQVMDQVSKALP